MADVERKREVYVEVGNLVSLVIHTVPRLILLGKLPMYGVDWDFPLGNRKLTRKLTTMMMMMTTTTTTTLRGPLEQNSINESPK